MRNVALELEVRTAFRPTAWILNRCPADEGLIIEAPCKSILDIKDVFPEIGLRGVMFTWSTLL